MDISKPSFSALPVSVTHPQQTASEMAGFAPKEFLQTVFGLTGTSNYVENPSSDPSPALSVSGVSESVFSSSEKADSPVSILSQDWIPLSSLSNSNQNPQVKLSQQWLKIISFSQLTDISLMGDIQAPAFRLQWFGPKYAADCVLGPGCWFLDPGSTTCGLCDCKVSSLTSLYMGSSLQMRIMKVPPSLVLPLNCWV